MAIVKMKRFSLLGFEQDRDAIMRSLQQGGWVQIDEIELGEDASPDIQRTTSVSGEVKQKAVSVQSAIETLYKSGAKKRSFFKARDLVKQTDFSDESSIEQAVSVGDEINELSKRIKTLHEERLKALSSIDALMPWKLLDIPLNIRPTAHLAFVFGHCPITLEPSELTNGLAAHIPMSKVYWAGEDKESKYLLCVCHPEVEAEMLTYLKTLNFSRLTFKDVQGTATQQVLALNTLAVNLEQKIEDIKALLSTKCDKKAVLELSYDRLTSVLERETAKERLLETERTFYLTGWTPAAKVAAVSKMLATYDCAVSYDEPSAEDAVPVQLKSNKFFESFNFVTELYSLPKYGTIDPNPLISIFFSIFFGMMFADVGYGAVLLIIGTLMLAKTRPRGGIKLMMRLMIICGITAIGFGVVFGSFFGNIITAFSGTFLSREVIWTPIVDVVNDPITLMVIALAMGGVQIVVGMAVKGYLMIRDGRPWDALMDVGSWWLLFAGIAVMVIYGTPWVAVAGAVALVCTQGRSKKGFAGKLMGGLGSLYDITAYGSDILSYLRLMALALATAIIANVFNLLATLPGKSVIGFIFFVAIFLFAHTFNMGINIIGTFVHAARLQFLEFFGKFYTDGGKAFKPMALKTKYVDIFEEETK